MFKSNLGNKEIMAENIKKTTHLLLVLILHILTFLPSYLFIRKKIEKYL